MIKEEKPNEPVTGSKTKERVQVKHASQNASKKEMVRVKRELPDQQRQIVAEIGRIHDDLRATIRLTAAKAIELGEQLTKLRKQLGHGHWGKFIKAHLPFDERTAERYMRLFKNREMLASKTDTLSDIFVTQAYTLVTKGEAATTGATSEDEPVTSSDGDRSRQRGKDEILTELQRGLVDGLEKLEPVLLEEFERDLRAFKSRWLTEHQQTQKEVVA